MINELGLLSQFIVSTLQADPTLQQLISGRVYRNIAPANAGTPYIIFSLVPTTSDITAIGGRKRIATKPLYLIKGVSVGPDDTIADNIADALDNAIVGAQDLVGASGLIVQGCYREMPIDYAQEDDGFTFWYRGGHYRFFVDKTTPG